MKLKLLEHYIAEAIAKTRSKPHRNVSALLAEVLPEIVAELRRMAISPDSDIPTRKFAITMLESFWRTLLSTAQGASRTAVKREHVKVRAKRVAAAETQTALAIAAERRRIDGVLDQATKELEGK